nr:hypothetical protein GCM10025732_54840 [Glycomyces mayteni]
MRDGGRGKDAQVDDLGSGGGEARGAGGGEHLAGGAGVAADDGDGAPAGGAEDAGGGDAEAECQVGREVGVRPPPYAVGAEQS